MKTKMFKSALSVLLILMLCVSMLTPTVSAAADEPDIPVVSLHVSGGNPPRASISESDVKKVFDDLELGEGSYYGIKQKSASGNPTNLSGLSKTTNVNAGEYLVYRTAVTSGTIIKTPNWGAGISQDIIIKLYYTAGFAVNGNDDGEIYLNGEAVSGNVELYTDTEYTVTAKQIAGYSCSISGAPDGEAFTPASDMTVSADYVSNARASVSVNVTGEGTVRVLSGGEEVNGFINAGSTFEVDAQANTDKGYRLGSVAVTKNGDPLEGSVFGPAENGDVFEVNVNFVFAPTEVNYEVSAASPRLKSSDFNAMFNESGTRSYGYASVDNPGSISSLNLLTGTDFTAGEYIIYSTSYSLLNPKWANARVLKLNLRTYYTGSFTVTGNDNGEVYLNNAAVEGNTAKLYTDTEYTVTAKNIDGYLYTMTGAEDGVAFTPSSEINVTVTYYKEAYAVFTLNVNGEGTAVVKSDGEAVTGRIDEGSTFTVEATPNTDKGYKLDSIVVTKDSEKVEAVDGVYGPVADGESYVVTVNFKFEPDEVEYELHGDANLTSSILNSVFGDSLVDMVSKSYGFASVDTPDQITNASVIGDRVEAGAYYIYRTGISTNPNWSNAKVLKLDLRTYYNGTFTVTGHDEGEIYLNNEAASGSVKLYTDKQYTVTTKQIEGYSCSLYGADEGIAFTPADDIEVSAVYLKGKYATVTVNANEGGSVKIVSGGDEVIDKIRENSTFAVVAKADSNNAYYVKSVVVTKDGVEIEAIDGEYGPVSGDESYEVTVTFAKATLTLYDGEVSLLNIYYKNYDAIEKAVISYAELVPAEFADAAQTKVEYVAYNLLGFEVYEPLNYNSDLSHPFGTSERGGTLNGGNTEKVRVTFTLPDYNIELRASAVMTVKDDRIETAIKSSADSLTITYGDDLKAAILDMITVYNVENGQPVEFTADDITVTPDSLNANLMSAYRAQDVTVNYKGSATCKASETTLSVYVKRAQSSLETASETITYGEIPEAKVVTTPENLDYIKIIAGIDGEAQGFVSIDIPNSVKERMQIKLGGIVLLDIYQLLSNYIGEDGVTIDALKNFVTDIYDRINSSELIRQAVESSGFNMETIDSIMGFIEGLPDFGSNIKIRLGQVPKNAGAYLLFAVSTDTNYTTSSDISYIIIKPESTTEDQTVELRFKNEIQGDGTMKHLSYEEAQDFDFGGALYINGVLTDTDKVHTLYVGTTYSGELIARSEPVTEPGIYEETVFIMGGNYFATPIIRLYTIDRIPPEPREFILGDANGDGIISVKDVTAIQRHVSELEFLTDLKLLAADIDGNGTVEIKEATYLQQYLIEMSCPYDIGSTRTES